MDQSHWNGALSRACDGPISIDKGSTGPGRPIRLPHPSTDGHAVTLDEQRELSRTPSLSSRCQFLPNPILEPVYQTARSVVQ